MKISYNWLKEILGCSSWIPIQTSALLTDIGLEVERDGKLYENIKGGLARLNWLVKF